MRDRSCLSCQRKLLKHWSRKYCSNKCQADFRYKDFIRKWFGGRKVETKNISRYIRRYLIETSGDECSRCGWNEIHAITGKVPIEVDHRDGNAENNSLQNLRLLCPNCHSLTDSFRNLNGGKGRTWRRERLAQLRS